MGRDRNRRNEKRLAINCSMSGLFVFICTNGTRSDEPWGQFNYNSRAPETWSERVEKWKHSKLTITSRGDTFLSAVATTGTESRKLFSLFYFIAFPSSTGITSSERNRNNKEASGAILRNMLDPRWPFKRLALDSRAVVTGSSIISLANWRPESCEFLSILLLFSGVFMQLWIFAIFTDFRALYVL